MSLIHYKVRILTGLWECNWRTILENKSNDAFIRKSILCLKKSKHGFEVLLGEWVFGLSGWFGWLFAVTFWGFFFFENYLPITKLNHIRNTRRVINDASESA